MSLSLLTQHSFKYSLSEQPNNSLIALIFFSLNYTLTNKNKHNYIILYNILVFMEIIEYAFFYMDLLRKNVLLYCSVSFFAQNLHMSPLPPQARLHPCPLYPLRKSSGKGPTWSAAWGPPMELKRKPFSNSWQHGHIYGSLQHLVVVWTSFYDGFAKNWHLIPVFNKTALIANSWFA